MNIQTIQFKGKEILSGENVKELAGTYIRRKKTDLTSDAVKYALASMISYNKEIKLSIISVYDIQIGLLHLMQNGSESLKLVHDKYSDTMKFLADDTSIYSTSEHIFNMFNYLAHSIGWTDTQIDNFKYVMFHATDPSSVMMVYMNLDKIIKEANAVYDRTQDDFDRDSELLSKASEFLGECPVTVQEISGSDNYIELTINKQTYNLHKAYDCYSDVLFGYEDSVLNIESDEDLMTLIGYAENIEDIDENILSALKACVK